MWLVQRSKRNPRGIKSLNIFNNQGVITTDKIVAKKVSRNVSLKNWKIN